MQHSMQNNYYGTAERQHKYWVVTSTCRSIIKTVTILLNTNLCMVRYINALWLVNFTRRLYLSEVVRGYLCHCMIEHAIHNRAEHICIFINPSINGVLYACSVVTYSDNCTLYINAVHTIVQTSNVLHPGYVRLNTFVELPQVFFYL